jgi:hypothetical protein
MGRFLDLDQESEQHAARFSFPSNLNAATSGPFVFLITPSFYFYFFYLALFLFASPGILHLLPHSPPIASTHSPAHAQAPRPSAHAITLRNPTKTQHQHHHHRLTNPTKFALKDLPHFKSVFLNNNAYTL